MLLDYVKRCRLGLGLSAMSLVISACTLAPGSHIPGNSFASNVKFDKPESLQVTRIAITPALVAERSRASQPNENKMTSSEKQYSYQIGPGDVLSIVVWDHPELTAPFGSFNNIREQGNIVREDGTIYYPFIGAVRASGRTALQVRNEMESRLATYIESPQVDVRVADYRSQRFYVAGNVASPGTFPITDVPVRLIDAINLAGGLNDEADLFDVRLSRSNETRVVPLYELLFEGNLSHNVLLRNGDIIHVAPNEVRKAFVLGEVVRPQALDLSNRPMSLTQALAAVGGIQEAKADGRGIYVIRNSEYDDLIDIYQLDISEASSLALGDKFILEQRDIVYVSAAPITRWNRWVSNVLPSLQGLFNIDRVGSN